MFIEHLFLNYEFYVLWILEINMIYFIFSFCNFILVYHNRQLLFRCYALVLLRNSHIFALIIITYTIPSEKTILHLIWTRILISRYWSNYPNTINSLLRIIKINVKNQAWWQQNLSSARPKRLFLIVQFDTLFISQNCAIVQQGR